MSAAINTPAAPAAPGSVQPELLHKPVFSTASAMALMWEKSYKQMTAKEMEWFADGAAEQVNNDVRALSATLEGLACLVSSDEESGSFQSARSTSTLLFNLHNQLNVIAGLADVSEQANWLARRALKGDGHD